MLKSMSQLSSVSQSWFGRAGSSDTILKGDHLRTIPTQFGPNWLSSFRKEDFLNIFPKGPYVKTMLADGGSSLLAGRVIGYNSERGPPKDHSNKIWSPLAKQFQRRRFLKTKFP